LNQFSKGKSCEKGGICKKNKKGMVSKGHCRTQWRLRIFLLSYFKDLGGIKMKKTLLSCIVVLLVFSLLVGCTSGGSSSTASSKTVDNLQTVELITYQFGAPSRDFHMALEKLNEKAQADLNATLVVNWIDWGDYLNQQSLVLASGEPVDLIFASDSYDFLIHAGKGAYTPLDELAPQYMPISYGELTSDAIQQCSVNGRLYAIPASFSRYQAHGIIVRGDLMDKYNIDTINSFDDYADFLEAVHINETEIEPGWFGATAYNMHMLYLVQNGYLLEDYFPLTINFDDPNHKVVNFFEDPGLLDFYKKTKTWEEKGCWPKDALTRDHTFFEGLQASWVNPWNSWKYTLIGFPELDAKFALFQKYVMKPRAIDLGTAVPASSKNPERALMLLEKLKQDKSYNDLMSHGVEGIHYRITDDGYLEPMDSEGFPPNGNIIWGFKETKFEPKYQGIAQEFYQVTEKIESNLFENPYTMFIVNIEPIKNEQAAVNNVIAQYAMPLLYGFVDDTEAAYVTLLEQLRAAGIETMREEIQRQLDEYIANQ